MIRVGFCVSGQGRLFREASLRRTALGIDPALLIADSDASAELEIFGAAADIPVVRLSRDDGRLGSEIERACELARVDLLSLTFDRILPPQVIAPRRGRIINVHPALLPAFRGKRAIPRAISADVRYAGATIHEVTEDVDGGPILAQCVVATAADESESSIGRRIYELLRPMYLQVLAWYAEGRVTKDEHGRVRVRDATYGRLPVSPALERPFL